MPDLAIDQHLNLLVTGGAGFIGSAVVRHLIGETKASVVNVDCMTYASNEAALASVSDSERYALHRVDIRDFDQVKKVLQDTRPTAILHLAAETHVDRSIDASDVFMETNVLGTHNLLRAALAYWRTLAGRDAERFRFHHVSTDEVYGELGATGYFTESTPYRPNSPYSASKAASDHLVRAWHRTYGLPVLVTNCSNNYGPFQNPEKLIPLMIVHAIEGRPLPVYGQGTNVRDWLYVEDHVAALLQVLSAGGLGQTYAIGGGAERRNLEVVFAICDILDRLRPPEDGVPRRELVQFVDDRPGHDLRYAIDSSKIERELGWHPLESFETGLARTVTWYVDNLDWCHKVAARGVNRT